MNRCRYVLWLSLVLLASPTPDAGAERLPLKVYTTADGLAHNDINQIIKDSHGFMWFCTAGGLSRFDGYAFTNFGAPQGLPHPSVNDLLETRSGEYWIATADGLVYFDPKGAPRDRAQDGRGPAMFTLITGEDQDRRSRHITALHEGRDGTIWVGTNRGLYRVERTGSRARLRVVDIRLPTDRGIQREITDVVEDPQGTLWVATPNGLYRVSNQTVTRYTNGNGVPNDDLHDLLLDHDGQLWVATRGYGFFRLHIDERSNTPVIDEHLSKEDGLTAEWVFQAFETTDRRMWAAMAGGLAEISANTGTGRRVRSYDENNGLTYFDITALGEDPAGNLWIGTKHTGAMKLTRGGFTTFGERDGIEQVAGVFEDAGRLCFRGSAQMPRSPTVSDEPTVQPSVARHATFQTVLGCLGAQGIDWFAPAVVRYFGWVGERVTLQTRTGQWWLATGHGLYRFPAVDNFQKLATARPLDLFTATDGLGPQVFRLFADSRGDVWASSFLPGRAGLARWQQNTGRLQELSRSPDLTITDDWPARSFAEDAGGNIWIGFDNELVRFDGSRFRVFTPADGLPPGAIRDIHHDRTARLWLASSRSGLVRVDDVASGHPRFVSYTTAQGLSSNDLQVITDDRDGRIYAGGSHGIDRLEPATGRIRHFTTADGLQPGSFLAAYRDVNGTLWFGMSNGLARLVPSYATVPAPPPVLIRGLSVRGVPHLVSALGEQHVSLPDLPPQQNQLQVDFTGLSFASGEILRYQYRLEEADTDWSALSEARSVTYASLPAGPHRFVVRAVNADGVESAEPAFITFTILRPVWQRWWFVTLVALTLGLIAYALYRYRVARLLEMANMRTRIATDLHDDIGANLTRIVLLSETAKQGAQEDGPLASIARIARESVGSMSDIVWAINPKRESLLDLTRRMRQHADEVFTQRGIELHFTAPGSGDTQKLGVDVRRDLMLMFKEAVNNAVRHSRTSRVDIDLRVQNARLLLTVADNGVGFDTSNESEGHGLTSMQRRARRLRGTLDIRSAIGGGTTVLIAIPT